MSSDQDSGGIYRAVLSSFIQSLKPTQQTWVLLLVSVVALGLFGVLAYLCWYVWLNGLWGGWALQEPQAGWKAVKILAAGLLTIYLLIIPFVPFVAVRHVLAPVAASLVSDRTQRKLADINEKQHELEEQLIANDATGLIQLVRYSRLQLEAYYTISLDQTRKSFRYSVLAMWIGFLVIISGVVMYIVPFEGVAGAAPKEGVHILTVASGTVIEVVSALFLWVYSRTIRQLTLFYNRQSYNHMLAMCLKITDRMTTNADETRRLIVEKAMAYPSPLPEDSLPGLGRLGGKAAKG